MKFKYLILIFLLIHSSLFASKKILINLSSQRAYAMQNNKIIFSGRISSGKPGRATPRGSFRILEKRKRHRSNLWPKRANGKRGGAKMPYMMRLTYTGYALHQGYVPNYPASHGCVRLQRNFAKKIFRWAKVGTKVKIVGYTPKPYISKTKRKSKRYTKRKKKNKYRRNLKSKKYAKKRYKNKKRRYKSKVKKRKRYVKVQKKYKKKKSRRRSKRKS